MIDLLDPPAPPSFASLWAAAVQQSPDSWFLAFDGPDGVSGEWSYGQFDSVVERAVGLLHAKGVRYGSSVHLALSNSPAFVALWLAALRLGAWIVPSDPDARVDELAEHIARVRPAVGFCGETRVSTYLAAAHRICSELQHWEFPVIALDEYDCDLGVFSEFDVPPVDDVGPTDRAAVMFTSGTTGRPKGVVVTQANYSFAGTTMAAACGLRSEHRFLVVLPMFHANAQYYCFASAVASRAAVTLVHRFSASRYLDQVLQHRATHLSLFAAPIRMILAHTKAPPVERLDVEHCWYAMSVGTANYERFSELIGCRPRQLYGMTETIAAVLTDSRGAPDDSTIGSPTAGCEVALHRGDGTEAEEGEVAEIVVGGQRGVTIFDGYLDDPVTTAAAFHGPWFRTGDRAEIDDRGNYRFSGRHADILKVAGENVSTGEIESVLSAHPEVLEAAVVGAPDPVRDEVPMAFVVPVDPSAAPTRAELTSWCEERLSKAKRPASITLVEELPRTSVGKVRKHALMPTSAECPTAEDVN